MTIKTGAPTFTGALDSLASGQRYADLVEMIGSVVNFGLPGVQKDVERWLGWVLNGGTRPEPTRRSLFANSGNAYVTTQLAICAVLNRLANTIDFDDLDQFWLVERATRPLDQTARHPSDIRHWNGKRRANSAS